MPHILLIEDEKALQEEVMDILELEGFEVTTADNGAMGVALAHQNKPDLIICDVMMPAMNGYEVLQEIRPTMPLVPFIFLTAKSTKTDVRYGMEIGADDYLTKPFTRNDLLSAISSRLARQTSINEAHYQRLEEAKRNFTRMVAHELRTPLISIQMVQEIISRNIEALSSKDLMELVGTLGTGSRRLSHLIEQLVFMTQLEAGMISKKAIEQYGQPKQISEIVNSAIGAGRGFVIRTDKTPVTQLGDVPQAIVLCDPRSLKHAFAELMANSLKFSSKTNEIVIKQWLERGFVHVSILDKGQGIPEEQLTRVFENFYQANREVHEQQGIGMGLSLARQIIEAHEGAIMLDSVVGKGTVVEVRLPLYPL